MKSWTNSLSLISKAKFLSEPHLYEPTFSILLDSQSCFGQLFRFCWIPSPVLANFFDFIGFPALFWPTFSIFHEISKILSTNLSPKLKYRKFCPQTQPNPAQTKNLSRLQTNYVRLQVLELKSTMIGKISRRPIIIPRVRAIFDKSLRSA